MTDDDAIIRLDQGGINARILAKEAKVDFRRVESASRKIQVMFHSPEVKRLFVRYFNSTQLNMYLISVIARTKLPHAIIEKVELALKAQLEKLHLDVNSAIDGAEALCKSHGITRLATYDTEPLVIEVKVISSLARRYLEVIAKVDQLMPMLETLAIDDVIGVAQLDVQKALAKKSVRQVAGAARNVLSGLRQRMNVISTRASTAPDGGNRKEGEAVTGPHLVAAVTADVSEVTSMTPDLAGDPPSAGTTAIVAPTIKQKGRAVPSAESEPRASATAP